MKDVFDNNYIDLGDEELNKKVNADLKEMKEKYNKFKEEIEKETLSQEFKDKLYENVMKKYNELEEKRKKTKKIILTSIIIIVLFAVALCIKMHL